MTARAASSRWEDLFMSNAAMVSRPNSAGWWIDMTMTPPGVIGVVTDGDGDLVYVSPDEGDAFVLVKDEDEGQWWGPIVMPTPPASR